MYRAPVREVEFVLHELIGIEALGAGAHPEAPYLADEARSVIAEAARFAEGVLAPINRSGDQAGARWTPEGVLAGAEAREAYRSFEEAGWPMLGADARFGGQPVNRSVAAAIEEFWASANLSFKLCPMLTRGAIEALVLCASPAQQGRYLPNMVTGRWTGTMNLTEPQAGSDLGKIRTRAVPEGDHYRLFGQKIFITWGDHDLAENIIHLVLARIDGGPPGVKGLSLFIVPKYFVDSDGRSVGRNDVRCASIEHKLGLHASPTCAMSFGDQGGAWGELIGEAGKGLDYMFVMMNAARLSVGLEGHALAERSFQAALEWARVRIQGRGGLPIIHHPDVKRMLLAMKSGIDAMRSLSLYSAAQLDLAAHHVSVDRRASARSRGGMLVPIVKGWCTELAQELVSLGMQVHGGMGYVEETGVAQYLRDARISPIYEGTTAIQANDLVGRKLGLDEGLAMYDLLAQMDADLTGGGVADPVLVAIDGAVIESLGWLRQATAHVLKAYAGDRDSALGVAVPYLKLCGYVVAGWLMAASAHIAAQKRGAADDAFYRAKVDSARAYTTHLLPTGLALLRVIGAGAPVLMESDPAII